MIELELPSPSERQEQFLREEHKYVGYGGARGGGKSWAVRIKTVLLCLRYPGIKVMIVRRTYPELQANHIEPLRQLLGDKIARYNDAKKQYRFGNGSTILFRYCATRSDMDRYQGTEVDVLFIDEATQFEEDVFRMFAACVRGVNDYPKRIYLTCNPGGRGHAWVKRLFIDRNFRPDENPADYAFVQALVQDNPALMRTNPDYKRQLEALPPKLREAWLYGNWDIFEGQFFEEFANNPAGYEERTFTHVIPAFQPPKHWRRFRSFDFGYAKPFSLGWWAQDPEGTLYRILELYGCTETPNEGLRWDADHIFREAARLEHEHPYLRGCKIEGVADPACWNKSLGPSVADAAARHGIYFQPGINDRINGWMQVHYRLAFDANGIPMLYVFDCCKAFIRTIPMLVYSEVHPEDLDTTQEDHVADEVRYMCMLDPIPPRTTEKRIAPQYDPLDIYKDDVTSSHDQYTYYRI